MSFTKGEWSVADCGLIVKSDAFMVARAHSGSGIPYLENSKANAKLIACAPEMYEMLNRINNIDHERGGSLGADGYFKYKVCESTFKAIERLLAKAKGEL